MRIQSVLGIFGLLLMTAACTGGQSSLPTENGIVLQSGTKITVDIQDVIQMGQFDSATIAIRSASPNFASSKVVLDLTALIKADVNGTSLHTIVLPKSIQETRPLLITVDMPDLNTQFVDVLYEGVSSVRPGLASSLTYELIKFYPGKLLTDYDAKQFVGIKTLIQARTDQLISESEHLSLSSTRFDRLERYFKNGLAFNISFLTAIKEFGVDYTWTEVTPAGLTPDQTPENSLDHYKLASDFKINGANAPCNPFSHNNNNPRLMPGGASINPSNSIFLLEGKKISLSVQAFDIDDDFMDKNFIIQYLPRVLPSSLVSGVVIPEPTPQYDVKTELSDFDKVDVYDSEKVGFNEALDLNYYLIDGDTAYRNIYYLISDGSIRIPYRWNFKYVDVNRSPKFLEDNNHKINDTSLDATLTGLETEGPPGWKQHASHCETDPFATYTDSGGSTVIYQPIHSRADGPWSCVFKVIDPDLDDDPNAAPDSFAYTVTQIDSFTEVKTNGDYIWPPLNPYTVLDPKKVTGASLPTCTDSQGVIHRRCGQALYQITVDNAVKVAAEQKADLMFNYDAQVFDRPANGLGVQHTISRVVQFLPIPPRIVNFAQPTPDPTIAPLDQFYINGSGDKVYSRYDTYLSEILYLADTNQTIPAITDIGFSNSMAGTANRSSFLAGTAEPISEYVTQPHSLSGTYVSFDAVTGAPIDGGAGTLNMLGHSFKTSDAGTYKAPREFDSTCNLDSNNFDAVAGWDQRPPGASAVQPLQGGGWTFEIDAIDYDNVGLRPGEPTDRVYFKAAHNIATSIFTTQGLFEYCQFLNPNTDIQTYQTYNAVGTVPAVNPDYCNWQSVPPTDMQPIPVFYKVVDGGVTKVRKLVYHRLRMKWKPKDQGMQGKTVIDPPGLIKNLLSNASLNGNRFANNNDTMDQVKLPNPIALVAQRKDMQPCMTGVGTGAQFIHQQSQNPAAFEFSIQDENKTLSAFPFYPSALQGRYEADMLLQGSRTIQDPEVLKWLAYVTDCSVHDTLDPAGVSPTPPPTAPGNEPLILYSRATDSSDIPHVRFSTITNPLPPTSGGMVCMSNHFDPLSSGGNAYLSSVVIQNLNTTSAYTLSLDTNCFSRSSIRMSPDIKYLAMASRCSGYTLGQVLWSDANSVATVRNIMSPVALGFPAGTPMRFKLLPSMYQADASTDKNSINSLFWELRPLDTFKLNGITGYPEYSGYGQWVTADPANAGPTPAPPLIAPSDYNVLTQYIDWDNGGPGTPLYLSLATATPDPASSNVFFRPAPGDPTQIQVFVKNHTAVTFPMRTSDVPTSTQIELDPYDVHQFTLGAGPATPPAAPPTFTGLGRTLCTDTPAGYPALGTLSYSSLAPYRTCQFNWTPNAGGSDDGNKYLYSFTTQDNVGGTASVMGIGGRHPAAASGPSAYIPSDNLAKTNGPSASFSISMESLETNTSPFFTATAGGATISQAYNSSGGAAGWSSVYPGGIAPACGSLSSGFTCTLSVANGDTLQNATPTDMIEGNTSAFSIFAKDTNVTPALKTLSLTSVPQQVLIVDGPHQGLTYNVPSFSSLSVTTTQNVAAGTATFSFNWSPTDTEANQLSNPGGFLIPLKITDTQYRAATDPGFPAQFVVAAKNSTIWLWAKMSVKNNTPTVYYVDSSNVERPLNGATVVFQSGTATNYKIRIKDTDLARLQKSLETTGFAPNLTLPPFLSASPAGTPSISGGFVVQDMVWGGTASNSDLGTYTSPNVAITEPGDPSLGLAVNPDAGSPARAMMTASGNAMTVPFNIQVIGKPIFLVPNATQNQVYAYSAQPFYYPLALSISRPAEMGKAMFIGLDNATTATPVKRTVGGAGIYVDENHVLRWLTPSFSDITIPPDRVLPLYGISKSYCNVGAASKTLIRFNVALNTIETCGVSAANVTNNLSTLQNLTLTLVNGGTMPTPPPITNTSLARMYTPTPTPSNTTLALEQQYADFKGRCGALCTYAPVTSNAAPSGLTLNASGASGFVDYTNNSYKATYTFNTSGTFSVTKTYSDTAPTAARSINAIVFKNEGLAFTADLGSTPTAPYPVYRWYVNGCLRAAGNVTSNQITFNQLTRGDMSGLNNDCTGQYNFAESGAGSLGKLIVRLSIVNGTEVPNTASDNATNYYVFNADVANTDPSLQTDPTITKSAPIALNNASYYTGTQMSVFGMPIAYGGKSYFAYTDYTSAAVGLRVHMREINSAGSLLTTGAMDLTCSSNFESQPSWIGIQPQSNGKLYIAASTVTSPYPTGSAANLVYGTSSKTCYTNNLSLASPSQSFINLGATSSVPAGYLGFSKYRQSSRAIASFDNAGGTLYRDAVNETNYFFISDATSSAQYWTYSLQNLYSSTPAELQSPYTNNKVRKSIVSGSNLIQLIGATGNSLTGWKGTILIGSVSPNGGAPNKLDGTVNNKVLFAGPSAVPAATANDCNFDGSPADGVYDSNTDSLYVLARSNDGTGKGHFVKIQNVLTSPSCSIIADTLNPSLDTTEYNPNISKMVLDPAHGLIYGLVNPGANQAGQMYVYDVYTQKLVVRDISSSITPYNVTYSPEMNSLYIYDNRRSGTVYPTLYRVW